MDVITIQQLHQDPALRNRVARRAYEIFIQRGRQMGREAEDWFKAEEEILQEVIEEQRVAMGAAPELENQNQEQLSNTSITGEAVAVISQENSVAEAPKKRTYTRRKKADGPVVEQEAKVENAVKPVATSETAPKTTRRPRSRTSVA